MNGGVMYLAELQAVKATISKTIIVLGPTLGMIPETEKAFLMKKDWTEQNIKALRISIKNYLIVDASTNVLGHLSYSSTYWHRQDSNLNIQSRRRVHYNNSLMDII